MSSDRTVAKGTPLPGPHRQAPRGAATVAPTNSALGTYPLSLASPQSEIEEASGVVPPIPCQQSVGVEQGLHPQAVPAKARHCACGWAKTAGDPAGR